MKMPKAGGFEYLVQARCALTSYPEWHMLRKENTRTLCAFIFEELLCRWGPITEIVTDNAPAYKVAVDELARKYGIHPIHISPYNSQANGIVERRHHDVREAIIKTCEGDKMRWSQVVHSVFWAEHVTIQKVMGLSPYFMMHGVEPIFPFDLAEATFLAPLEC
jgi:transposase InsO family protein